MGLGNPGPRYAGTRHNAGFLVAERLASRWGARAWRNTSLSLMAESRVADEEVFVALPQTFMNRSGEAVALLLRETGADPSRMLVVHDDLDLPFGKLRVRVGGGAGGHRGIASVREVLGTGDFLRLKIGIGRPGEGTEVIEHVLAPFAPDEAGALPGLLDRAVDAVECIVAEGAVQAMNRYNG